uniref:Sialic acid-binding Ig-like lectin 13 n=1 Tax=Geotrypetes seraphini TaxID=260995 RepID=A0A6P8SMU6_GEOSA|nr:sialic acid-binding Ig-like lectin 13 [Geotrypetes seraphini]
MNCSVTYPGDANLMTMVAIWYTTDKPNYEKPPYFSNDLAEGRTEMEGRYQTIGDVNTGDCRFRLDRARQVDDGIKLYLRIRGRKLNGELISYLFTEQYFLVKILPLTEKPTIMHSTPFANRPVKYICTAPGRCKGHPIPIIRWIGSLTERPTVQNTSVFDGRTAIYSSSYIIRGSYRDNGKLLKCLVSLDDGVNEVTAVIRLNFIGNGNTVDGQRKTKY